MYCKYSELDALIQRITPKKEEKNEYLELLEESEENVVEMNEMFLRMVRKLMSMSWMMKSTKVFLSIYLKAHWLKLFARAPVMFILFPIKKRVLIFICELMGSFRNGIARTESRQRPYQLLLKTELMELIDLKETRLRMDLLKE